MSLMPTAILLFNLGIKSLTSVRSSMGRAQSSASHGLVGRTKSISSQMAFHLLTNIPEMLFLVPPQQCPSPAHQRSMQIPTTSQSISATCIHDLKCLLSNQILLCSQVVTNGLLSISCLKAFHNAAGPPTQRKRALLTLNPAIARHYTHWHRAHLIQRVKQFSFVPCDYFEALRPNSLQPHLIRVTMKTTILSLLLMLFAGAYLAQDVDNYAEGGYAEQAEGVGESVHRVVRDLHECVNTPKKCSKINGICINIQEDCEGNADDSLCNHNQCTCCVKHECSNTPKKCENENGICINKMNDCAGKTDEGLCHNQHCTCCKKHQCSNTPEICSNANGTCINIMDHCAGRTDKSLCHNKHCTCCIKRACENTPSACANRNGTCINIMDTCEGESDESLCFNQNCKCCIPA
ncbi:uncharacterized protein LOC122243365 [Penaeus japonicus]|uniref:uncharacterized protein LOC122243365 n=1 Tax=Penaeus japonicus TaxID=27405 RepID=UPI001C70B449|nr:uncharacterized protein LOC122243365 [Penaeus japonicus]